MRRLDRFEALFGQMIFAFHCFLKDCRLFEKVLNLSLFEFEPVVVAVVAAAAVAVLAVAVAAVVGVKCC